MFIIFPETVPEVPGSLQDEMVDCLERLEDSVGRGSLQPLGEVIHQVSTVVWALKTELNHNLVNISRCGLLTPRGRLLEDGVQVGGVGLLCQLGAQVAQC